MLVLTMKENEAGVIGTNIRVLVVMSHFMVIF